MPLPPTIRCVALTGFMGAGKSTTGALLAETLGWRFVDSDGAIEARSGLSVGQIFAQLGEKAFREMEAEVVQGHVQQEGLVLALGGGCVENELTREALYSAYGIRVVFLDAPLDVMVARCVAQPDAAERPVLADRDGLRQRFLQRLPYYRAAHLTVSTADLTPAMVVDRILCGLLECSASNLEDAGCSPEKGSLTQ